MSILPAYMSELWKCLELVMQEELASINASLISTQPENCDAGVLPFLAWESNVNIDDLNELQARSMIASAIKSQRYTGTLLSIREMFSGLADVEITEYFSEKPFYFNVKLLIDDDIPGINKYAYLLDRFKNVRSKYELEFDMESVFSLYTTSASSVRSDFFQGLNLDKSSSLSCQANNIFMSDFTAILDFEKISEGTVNTASTFELETKKEFFDVSRFTEVKNQAIANMRLDFSYNESDVMHLPIPPIMLNTAIGDMSVAVFNMDFSQNGSDVFHLNHNKNYEVVGGVGIDGYGVMDMEFYDECIMFNAKIKTLISNANSVNLDI
jgi:phage tail P2-like protein